MIDALREEDFVSYGFGLTGLEVLLRHRNDNRLATLMTSTIPFRDVAAKCRGVAVAMEGYLFPVEVVGLNRRAEAAAKVMKGFAAPERKPSGS